jgi:uncharacterized membrane protein YedE/YeeE
MMIENMRELVVDDPGIYVSLIGLLIGTVFGYIVYVTNFCTMGSISDILNFGDYKRFRSWLLAAAVAIIGATYLQNFGISDINSAMYLTPNFNWLGNVVGGLLFGFGMVFAGGCVSRNLVRAGAGDLRSALVLVVTGIFGYMTIGGILGPIRLSAFDWSIVDLTDYNLESQSAGSIISLFSGIDASSANLAAIVVIVAALIFYCFKDASFRKSIPHLVAGTGIGLCVVAGWMITGLAFDEFAEQAVPVASLTFVRPTGDTLEYLMRFTALGAPGFGVVSVAGALLGGFLGAFSKGRFNLTTFANAKDTVYNMFGAALMGIGGVLALGCTVGQALSGFSTMAVGSMITFVFIIIGGIAGVKYLERLIMADV